MHPETLAAPPDHTGVPGLDQANAQINAIMDVMLETANQPRFHPTVAQAKVRVPAVAHLAGQDQPVAIAIDDAYVQSAWDGARNAGAVFAKLLQPAGLNFPGDKTGGLAAPNLLLQGLSRQFGPIGGDISKLAQGVFNPQDFFKDAASKLFGCIDLWQIIKGVFGAATIPGLTVDYKNDSVVVKYDWHPVVQDFAPLFKANMNGDPATFDFTATLVKPLLPGKDATYNSNAALKKFTVDMSFLIVSFNQLAFAAASGKKPDVTVDIAGVEFGGALEFVNELKTFLSSGGLGGLSLDISPTSINAGFSIQLPEVAVGIMSLQNMAVSAGITLSYVSDPIDVRFAFCSRDNPFLITVSLFGGGGFFGLELTPAGMKLVEASFEFGGNFSLDVGVASGGVYLMAGIYFKYESGDCTLTGYVRCGGNLDVLGLIHVSLEFYMGLTYESAGNRVYGQATLTVDIEILFFSMSVGVTVEREFAGSDPNKAAQAWPSLDGERVAALDLAQLRPVGGRPRPVRAFKPGPPAQKITDAITAADWAQYCQAFA